MAKRPITEAEMEAARTPKGGWNAAQLRAWGISWPPPAGWRKQLLRSGVPAACPYPGGFEPATTAAPLPSNPLTAFGAKPAALALPPDTIEIFTDGSCDPNPGPGGWGFAVYRGKKELHAAHGGDQPTTNNRMELSAIIAALRWLDSARPAIVWSDSQYVVRGCTEWRHGWRRRNWTRGREALANADLWQALDALLDSRMVDIRWTRGHAGTAGNERADELADLGRAEALRQTSRSRRKSRSSA